MKPTHHKTTYDDILRVVCKERGVTKAQINSPQRTRPIAHARQEIAAIASRLTKLSLPEIGRKQGRDRTTVIHSLRAVKKRRAEVWGYWSEIEAMQLKVLRAVEAKPVRINPAFQHVRA